MKKYLVFLTLFSVGALAQKHTHVDVGNVDELLNNPAALKVECSTFSEGFREVVLNILSDAVVISVPNAEAVSTISSKMLLKAGVVVQEINERSEGVLTKSKRPIRVLQNEDELCVAI